MSDELASSDRKLISTVLKLHASIHIVVVIGKITFIEKM